LTASLAIRAAGASGRSIVFVSAQASGPASGPIRQPVRKRIRDALKVLLGR
jgi:hypothetical protein